LLNFPIFSSIWGTLDSGALLDFHRRGTAVLEVVYSHEFATLLDHIIATLVHVIFNVRAVVCLLLEPILNFCLCVVKHGVKLLLILPHILIEVYMLTLFGHEVDLVISSRGLGLRILTFGIVDQF
jgi:hypothetical protein